MIVDRVERFQLLFIQTILIVADLYVVRFYLCHLDPCNNYVVNIFFYDRVKQLTLIICYRAEHDVAFLSQL